jgi:four helix bundle protein
MASRAALYRELIVWQRAIELLVEIYRLTPCLPRDERFGITSQLHRAAVSVSANIAEGNGRRHRAEYAHHVSIARGSTLEVESLLLAAIRLGMLDEDRAATALRQLDEISRMLNALYRTLTFASRERRSP